MFMTFYDGKLRQEDDKMRGNGRFRFTARYQREQAQRKINGRVNFHLKFIIFSILLYILAAHT